MMAKFTKTQLEQILDHIIAGLEPGALQGSGAYSSLYPEDIYEYDIANAVPEFPELHQHMVQLVKQVISLPEYPVWADEEDQAGGPISSALALYDKQYCSLFAKCLARQDLDHEVNQNDCIRKVVGKWGPCKETALLLEARKDNPGQHGPEIVEELMNNHEGFIKYTDIEQDEEADRIEPRISLEKIEKAKSKKQLEKYYLDISADFTNEFIALAIDAILSFKKGSKPSISVLSVHLKPEQNAIAFSVTDDAGNTHDSYQTVHTTCLDPLHTLCCKLGYKTDKRVKEIAYLYIVSSVGGFDKGTFAKPFKIEVYQ